MKGAEHLPVGAKFITYSGEFFVIILHRRKKAVQMIRTGQVFTVEEFTNLQIFEI